MNDSFVEHSNSSAFKVLAGYSVILSENGKFTNSNASYSYAQSDFVIHGMFDGNSNMIDGQKFKLLQNHVTKKLD